MPKADNSKKRLSYKIGINYSSCDILKIDHKLKND